MLEDKDVTRALVPIALCHLRKLIFDMIDLKDEGIRGAWKSILIDVDQRCGIQHVLLGT